MAKLFTLCTFVLIASVLNSNFNWDYFKDKIECGKSNPGDSDSKCHKYGTDSGFKCCWIKKEGEESMCRLVSYGELESYGIKGGKKDYPETDEEGVTKLKFSCRGSYLHEISFALIIVLVSLVMF